MIPYLSYGIIITFVGAYLIDHKCKSDRQKAIALFVTILLAMGQLAILKYANFFIYSSNIFGSLFNIRIGLNEISLIAPIGISYYTLSIVGYVVDVYRKTIHAQTNIFKHALFTCYFPQMTSGPITRYHEMESQLFGSNKFEFQNIKFGLERMLWGLFKKLVIADRIVVFVNAVYSDYDKFSGFYIAVAVLFFAIQLYCDFSGCMDIILGASQCFGIKLPENFNTPFFSRTVSEFWRRWHMTLGFWVKDYILFPLLKTDFLQAVGQRTKKTFGKKYGKKIPTIMALMVVWLFVGIWHGGTYKFLFLSGILPGFYLIMAELLEGFFAKLTKTLRINTECFSFSLFRCFRTFLLMCGTWVFIPAKSLMDGFNVIKSIFSARNPWVIFDDSLLKLGLDYKDMNLIFIAVLIVIIVEILHYNGIHIRESLNKQNIVFQWIIIYVAIFSVLIFGIYGPGYETSAFIYENF